MSAGKHLSRKELIRLARSRDRTDMPHLDECTECREAFELLTRYHEVIGRTELPAPPADLLARARGIGRQQQRIKQVIASMAALVFDSWAAPIPVGVRGPATVSYRRLHFRAESTEFELRAEKKSAGWSFVAQCTGTAEPAVLKCDKDVVLPDALGVYQWQSATPPRQMALYAPDVSIVLPKLQWKRPKLK